MDSTSELYLKSINCIELFVKFLSVFSKNAPEDLFGATQVRDVIFPTPQSKQ